MFPKDSELISPALQTWASTTWSEKVTKVESGFREVF